MTEINKKQYTTDVRIDVCSDITSHARQSRLMIEFDKFAAKEGESLESMYERLTTLVNIMDRNNVLPISLYDSLEQFEPHIQASKAKKAARNHDPLALIAHSKASSSQYHASPSYSHSPQSYYVTHPSSIVDYEKYYQGDSQEDKLTMAMINQAVIQDGRVNIQTKNGGYGGNGNRNAGRQNRNQPFNVKNELSQNDAGHYACDCQKPRVHDAKYFREKILLAMKDDAGSNLIDEENDFRLDNSYRDESLEELTTAVIMIARIQPVDDNTENQPNYDAKAVSEVNDSNKNHRKRKNVINTSDDDQIDSNIIFDDSYVENNGGSAKHD
ncbi:hypothetical protein Tco_0800113 [Tanacetum coccineum]|uniref:Uncharacterized protein n=1 Tax=Tanacetum coccineum TaxID=301880 RepID=A0ABQ4ZVY8_9ASTR